MFWGNLLRIGSFGSKSVFLIRFAYANLALKTAAKVLNFGILFSAAVNAAFVAKPLILGILPW